jgi:hypothetical protein
MNKSPAIYIYIWEGEAPRRSDRNSGILLLWREFSLLHSRGKPDLHALIRPAFGLSKLIRPVTIPQGCLFRSTHRRKTVFLFWIDAKNCVSKYKHSRASRTSIFSDGVVLHGKQKKKKLKTLKVMRWRCVTFENLKRWTLFKIWIH